MGTIFKNSTDYYLRFNSQARVLAKIRNGTMVPPIEICDFENFIFSQHHIVSAIFEDCSHFDTQKVCSEF